MSVVRSPERIEFLSDLIITAVYHNHYGFPEVEWTTDIHAQPFSADITDRYVDDPCDPEYLFAYCVDIDLMARGVNLIINDRDHRLVSAENRRRVMVASKANDAGDMDVVDCLAILEIAIFGKIVYC